MNSKQLKELLVFRTIAKMIVDGERDITKYRVAEYLTDSMSRTTVYSIINSASLQLA